MSTASHSVARRATAVSHHRLERLLTTDVVVVGARCAGAATALLLARAGHDVLLLDRATFPSDTVSTHVIARSGMVQLHRWGLLDTVVASGAPPIRRVEFSSQVGFMSRDVKDRYGVDFLLAPRRTVLDPILQDAAVSSGARLLSGVAVEDVVRDGRGRVIGVEAHDDERPLLVHARYVVGADGLGSRIARSVGAPLTVERAASGAAQYAYYAGDWTAIEHHLGDDVFAGVFPTHDGQACIWACTPESLARAHRGAAGSPEEAFARVLADAVPGLAGRLDPSARRSPVRGMLRMPNHLRRAAGPGWALAGDAGYHRDAITGHGISDAFRDAELLAGALDEALREPDCETDALVAYEQNRDRMAKDVFDITCALAAFPEQAQFLELQKRLAVAIDEMARELSTRRLLQAATAAA